MTLADDPQNPKPAKKLAKSMDAITALREAMEKRLQESQKTAASAASVVPRPEPTKPIIEAKSEPKEEPPKVKTPAPQISNFAAKIQLPALNPAPANNSTYDATEWSRILLHIGAHSQILLSSFLERNKAKGLFSDSIDPAHFAEAFGELTTKLMSDPQRFVGTTIGLWQGYAQIWQTALMRMQGQPVDDAVKPSPGDKRFQDQDWQTNWLFDFLKQSYLLTAEQTKALIHTESQKLDPKLGRKVEFAARQMVDAMSPSNFWITNPEALRSIYTTGGESLMKGFENLLADLESGKGDLRIRMTDTDAFKLGENLAYTSGKVIFQNPLMQLIQYTPSTADVHRVPILILPPWINKYYILDLREKNSFIRYLVSQGHTVFCVSWVNPDARHAQVNFEDYMVEGALAAMREVMRVTSIPEINIVGYCIGGTLLASTLGYLTALPKAPADIPKVVAATYLVTMVDFAEPGDLGAFIDDDMLKMAEERMAQQGYLDAATMATVFNMLRSNDLIWSYVVNNYLLGKDPSSFDILYWNSDSTNMPAAMQRFYLREMYQNNNLIKPNGVTLNHVPIDLHKITVPSFMLAAREDHIAPWKSTYTATQTYKGPVTFMLASSGHIAGVVNPPTSGKYGYWTNNSCPAAADAWLASAKEHKGSWWSEWLKWLGQYAGEKVPARTIAESIENAPGSYVKVRAV